MMDVAASIEAVSPYISCFYPPIFLFSYPPIRGNSSCREEREVSMGRDALLFGVVRVFNVQVAIVGE
jgi:hypothetical protein